MARVPAEGSTLSYAVTAESPISYTQLALVFRMPGPNATRPTITANALEDTAAVKFPGKIDYGETTYECYLDPAAAAQYAAMRTHFDAATPLTWKITNPVSVAGATASTEIWEASVSQLSSNREVDGMLTFTMALLNTTSASFTAET